VQLLAAAFMGPSSSALAAMPPLVAVLAAVVATTSEALDIQSVAPTAESDAHIGRLTDSIQKLFGLDDKENPPSLAATGATAKIDNAGSASALQQPLLWPPPPKRREPIAARVVQEPRRLGTPQVTPALSAPRASKAQAPQAMSMRKAEHGAPSSEALQAPHRQAVAPTEHAPQTMRTTAAPQMPHAPPPANVQQHSPHVDRALPSGATSVARAVAPSTKRTANGTNRSSSGHAVPRAPTMQRAVNSTPAQQHRIAAHAAKNLTTRHPAATSRESKAPPVPQKHPAATSREPTATPGAKEGNASMPEKDVEELPMASLVLDTNEGPPSAPPSAPRVVVTGSPPAAPADAVAGAQRALPRPPPKAPNATAKKPRQPLPKPAAAEAINASAVAKTNPTDASRPSRPRPVLLRRSIDATTRAAEGDGRPIDDKAVLVVVDAPPPVSEPATEGLGGAGGGASMSPAQGAPETSVAGAASTTPAPAEGWGLSRFFSWFFGHPTAPALLQRQPNGQAATSTSSAQAQPSGVVTRVPRPRHEDFERTSRATKADSLHIVMLQDPWRQREQEDDAEVARVRREDEAARIKAEWREAPRRPTPEEVELHRSTHVSAFWSKLEREDAGLEASLADALDGPDGFKHYEELEHLQDQQVNHAAEELESESDMASRISVPPALHRHERDMEAKTIHDPWEKLEAADRTEEQKVRRDPYLRMVQLSRRSHSRVAAHGAAPS